MRRCLGLCSCVAVAIATGCSKKAAPPPKEAAPATTAAKVDAGPPPVVGMDDPFVRLTGDVAKSLKAGYKAMQAKKYDEARTAFAAVVSAVPDYSPARMQEVKAAALGGHAADVPELWKALLARDYVAYAGRLDKPKEFAPLRAGPEWDRIKAQEANVRTAYAADLAKGLFFVGRSRELGISKGGEGTAKLALNQEVYQVDAAAKRYRRLTETEGRVFAYSVAPENKAISFLMVTTIADATGPMPEFVDASVGSIDLATLETTGPLRLGPAGTRATAVVMGWTAQGDPVWTLRAGDAAETFYTLDATRTATVTVLASGAVTSHRTTAAPSSVSTVSMPADQVTVADDRRSLQIVDEDRTLRATRVLDPDSVVWAPAGRRLAYAGAFDECKPGGGKDKNELFAWERGKKTAARIATAPSVFRLAWLDDDRLVYQAGAGKQSKIHVLDVATKKDAVLKPRAGAAITGFGAVVCPGAAPEESAGENVDEDTEDAD
ncbi:MAG TPA: hypothetical protein VIQ54_19420 [Polyangia bacterium]